MARSWASVARSGLPQSSVTPKPSVLRAEAPEWNPPPSCYYCGAKADVCPECVKVCSYYPAGGLQPVLKEGLCAQHVRHGVPHAFFNMKMADFIPQTCSACREKHPWRPEDSLEVTGFSYERANLDRPLKSPNGGRFNVVYVARYRYVRLGQAKSTSEQVAEWAEAAYAKEMEFSGDKGRADYLKEAVLDNNGNVYMPFDLQ